MHVYAYVVDAYFKMMSFHDQLCQIPALCSRLRQAAEGQ